MPDSRPDNRTSHRHLRVSGSSGPGRLGLVAGLLTSGVLLAACTGANAEGPGEPGEPASDQPVSQVAAPPASTVLAGGGPTGLSIRASQSVWVASPAAVTADPDRASINAAGEAAVSLALPLLVLPESPAATAGTGGDDTSIAPSADPSPAEADPVAAELERLGVTHVLHVGEGAPDLGGVEVVRSPQELPARDPIAGVSAVAGVTVKGERTKATTAALATLEAAGATALQWRNADPRIAPRDVRSTAQAAPEVAIGLGAAFGDPDVFAQRVATAATGVQLPGGGQTGFDDKRYVALYGHPLTGALGVLGEQGPSASVDRARRVAAQYEAHADETIVPAFEIIATVAAGGAGDDGNYSNEWDVDVLQPLVEAAGEAGIYVVIDLQSGRSPFLPQAKLYRELLLEPHVGLALDPEWRLKKGQKPLRQIGSVSAAEINRTLDWLAELTAANDLPQKMVLLHQFRTDMITNRAELDLTHDELAVIVQMDGDGTLGQKLDTWRALRAGAPEELRFGWKNFYDEDEPTPSPATTFAVEPKPWWVSYQ